MELTNSMRRCLTLLDQYGEALRSGPRSDQWSWYINGIPMSYGLTQVRRNNGGKVGPNWDGSFPLSKDSTAFNLDVWGASVRQYFEGCAAQIGGPNSRGDVWSSLGHWFWGWGSINDAGAQDYINAVRNNYTNQVWARSGF